MRRPTILVLLACALALLVPQAQAAGSPAHRGSILQAAHLTLPHLHGLTRTPALQPKAHVAAPSRYVNVTSSLQLQLPNSAMYQDGFQPDSAQARPMSASDAWNNTLQGIYLHQPDSYTYTALGVLGAYYMESAKKLASGNTEYLTYLGTYYGNTDAARNAFNTTASGNGTYRSGDGAQIVSGLTQQVCSAGDSCMDFSFYPLDTSTLSPLPFKVVLRVVLAGNAMMEGGYFVNTSDAPAQQSALETDKLSIANAFLQVMNKQPANNQPTATSQPTAAPAPTVAPPPTTVPITKISFSVDSVRVEKNNAKPDFTLKSKPLRSIKHGTTVRLSIYVDVSSAPKGAAVDTHFLVKRNGTSISDRHETYNLDSADPTGKYRFALKGVKFSKKGTYTITIRIQIGDQVQQDHTSLKVT